MRKVLRALNIGFGALNVAGAVVAICIGAHAQAGWSFAVGAFCLAAELLPR